jgi:chitin disaccharide deacetylase
MGTRLIINADDFGHSPGVNQAVIEAHAAGVLTSTSLMVSEPAVADAVARAREHPQLAVGLHLTLLRGRPVRPAKEVSRLVRGGRFGDDPVRVGLRYFISPTARRQVRWEVEGQFERFAATGLPLSHVDAHLHFHQHPVILDALLRLAPRFGCRHLRIPLDSWSLYRRVDPADAMKQAPLAAIFEIICAGMRRRARRAGLLSPGYCFGLFRTGRLDPEYLAGLTRQLPEGLHELHCHPDRDTPSGRQELASLLSPALREALAERSVTLATYADLERPSP